MFVCSLKSCCLSFVCVCVCLFSVIVLPFVICVYVRLWLKFYRLSSVYVFRCVYVFVCFCVCFSFEFYRLSSAGVYVCVFVAVFIISTVCVCVFGSVCLYVCACVSLVLPSG